MCIFSRSVIDVSKTKIFARKTGIYQYIAYQMDFQLYDETAIILPIPCALNTPEDGIEFIDFKKHDKFFMHLYELFEDSGERSRGVGPKSISLNMPLTIHVVGDFEASFVPTLADFDRVDERFKLQPEIWQQLPQYKDYGFVVFKLRKDATTVHPMVFKFPSAMNGLYFPTLHIHDGQIHKLEKFDHILYCQDGAGGADIAVPGSWQFSKLDRNPYFRSNETCLGVLDRSNDSIFMRKVTGTQRNEDMVLYVYEK